MIVARIGSASIREMAVADFDTMLCCLLRGEVEGFLVADELLVIDAVFTVIVFTEGQDDPASTDDYTR